MKQAITYTCVIPVHYKDKNFRTIITKTGTKHIKRQSIREKLQGRVIDNQLNTTQQL